MEAKEETREETRARILKVSHDLFNHYGYSKTTMSDIAKELNMSPANIYRFYPGKEDIMAEIADGVANEFSSRLREIVRRPGLSASERLEEFILDQHRLVDSISKGQEKLDEAIEFIHIKRPDLMGRYMEMKKSMIAEIISEGNRTGEFDVIDVVATAEAVLHATSFCKCHWVGVCPPLDEVLASARKVVEVLVAGLRKK